VQQRNILKFLEYKLENQHWKKRVEASSLYVLQGVPDRLSSLGTSEYASATACSKTILDWIPL
jgi:hypothetical protein